MVLTVTLGGVATQASATTSAENGPEFASSSLTDERGDVVPITVRLSNSERAEVHIQGQQSPYDAKVRVRDRNGDGLVTLEFNTFLAGEDGAFTVADRGDSISILSQSGSEKPLPTGRYRLKMDAGDEISELEIVPRSTSSLRTLVAPDGGYADLQSTKSLSRYREAGNLTARPEGGTAVVARRDTMVLRIQASGISGAMAAQQGDTVTERFHQLVESDLVSLNVTHTNPSPDVSPIELLLNRSGVTVAVNRNSDSYFVVVDTAAVHYRHGDGSETETGLPVGARFRVNLTVEAGTRLTDDGRESVESSFEIVRRTASLGTHREAGLNFLDPDRDQTVSGRTTLAPGTAVELVLRTPDGSVRGTRTTEVVADSGGGAFEAVYNLQNLAQGTTVRVTASDQHGPLNDDPMTATVRSPEATMTDPSLTTGNGTLYATIAANLTRGGVVTVRASNDSGRILGVTSVSPGETTVSVPLSELPPKGTPLVVTAVRDLDSDRRFSPDSDVAYTQTTSDRPVQVTMALYRLTPSPTPTPGSEETPSTPGTTADTPTTPTTSGTLQTPGRSTDSSSVTSTPEDGPLSTVTPGFGSVIGLAALLVGALLLARRQ